MFNKSNRYMIRVVKKDLKIFIIDENEYNIMILVEEY